MRPCRSFFIVSLFVLLTSSVWLLPAANAQTQASCTFKIFNPPSGFSGDFLPMGINHYNTVVGQANTANQNSAKAFIRFSGSGISLFAPKGALHATLNKRNAWGTSVGQYRPTMTGNNPPLSGTCGLIVMTSKSFATLDFPGAGEPP